MRGIESERLSKNFCVGQISLLLLLLLLPVVCLFLVANSACAISFAKKTLKHFFFATSLYGKASVKFIIGWTVGFFFENAKKISSKLEVAQEKQIEFGTEEQIAHIRQILRHIA